PGRSAGRRRRSRPPRAAARTASAAGPAGSSRDATHTARTGRPGARLYRTWVVRTAWSGRMPEGSTTGMATRLGPPAAGGTGSLVADPPAWEAEPPATGRATGGAPARRHRLPRRQPTMCAARSDTSRPSGPARSGRPWPRLAPAIALVVALGAAGCFGAGTTAQTLSGDAPRAAPAREFANGAVSATNQFGIDLYK